MHKVFNIFFPKQNLFVFWEPHHSYQLVHI